MCLALGDAHMIPLFRVIKSGVYATIQDRGRFGFRRFGMPVAGPMDRKAFQLGQEIIDHKKNGNALELFLGGLTLEVLTDHRIVIAGADLGALIDGKTAGTIVENIFDLERAKCFIPKTD